MSRSDVRLNCVTVATMGSVFPTRSSENGMALQRISNRGKGLRPSCSYTVQSPVANCPWERVQLGWGSFLRGRTVSCHVAVSCQQPNYLALKEWSTLILENLDDEPQCQLQFLSCDAWIHLFCNKLSLSGSSSFKNLTGFLIWETKKKKLVGRTAAHAASAGLKFESGFHFLPLLHPIPHPLPLNRTYANRCLPGGPPRLSSLWFLSPCIVPLAGGVNTSLIN